MKGQEIKGRLDRIGKTTLEHFQDIKELEVADGPEIKVEDIVPYKCEQVEKSLKALEIIKSKNVWVARLKGLFKKYNNDLDVLRIYNANMPSIDYQLTQEEFNLLKEVLK